MLNKRNVERKLFSVSMLYLLFLICLVGIYLGTTVFYEYGASITLPNVRRNFAVNFGQCLVYYGSILFFSRQTWGVFAIPIILWFKSFVFGIAASAVMSSQAASWKMIAELCIPAVFHFTGLMYLASHGIMMSRWRRKNYSLRHENVKELRSGVLWAGFWGITGALLDFIL